MEVRVQRNSDYIEIKEGKESFTLCYNCQSRSSHLFGVAPNTPVPRFHPPLFHRLLIHLIRSLSHMSTTPPFSHFWEAKGLLYDCYLTGF